MKDTRQRLWPALSAGSPSTFISRNDPLPDPRASCGSSPDPPGLLLPLKERT